MRGTAGVGKRLQKQERLQVGDKEIFPVLLSSEPRILILNIAFLVLLQSWAEGLGRNLSDTTDIFSLHLFVL